VLNALLRGKRRRRVTDANLRQFLVELSKFRITVAAGLGADEFVGLLELSERLGLSVWDAAYLDLAKKSGVPLATGDAGAGTGGPRGRCTASSRNKVKRNPV
jgi:predicted nucleic acid-binding protein